MTDQASGSVQWIGVPPTVARQYRYHGIAGWLLFFLIVLCAMGAFAFFAWVRMAAEVAPRLSLLPGPLRFRLGVLFLLLTLMIVWLAIGLVRGFRLSPSFPKTICWYFGFAAISTAVITLVVRDGHGPLAGGGNPAVRIVGALVVNSLLIWYFASSKRVNATYLHRLDPRDPAARELLARAEQQAEAPAPASDASVQQRLAELKVLRDEGLIDEEDYETKRREILRDL